MLRIAWAGVFAGTLPRFEIGVNVGGQDLNDSVVFNAGETIPIAKAVEPFLVRFEYVHFRSAWGCQAERERQ